MKRIHIVGISPRTGTTLMAEAINTCYKIDCYTKHEDRLFSRAPSGSNIHLTKCPRDIMIVGPSLSVDPNLYVICMIRDPRDVICSKHKKDPDHYWTSLKFWNTYSREVDKLIDHPRFIPVWYEFFVSNPDKLQKKLSEKIPFLEEKIPFSRYHEAAEVSPSSREALLSVRPISPQSVGKWRNHKARIAGQLKLHGSITNDLIKFGYEDDDHWLNELCNIEPDFSSSHHDEYMTAKKIIFLKLGKYLEAFRRFLEQIIDHKIRVPFTDKLLLALLICYSSIWTCK